MARRISMASILFFVFVIGICLFSLEASCSMENKILVEDEVQNAAVLASQGAPDKQQEESYQKVYEAFSRLMQSVSNNSIGNVRRLVTRLNRLVGTSNNNNNINEQQLTEDKQKQDATRNQQSKRQPTRDNLEDYDNRTEELLQKLNSINKQTDQNTIRQLNEDVNKLVNGLGDAYLRNIRRLIERVEQVVGTNGTRNPNSAQNQAPDRLDDPTNKTPGFPGWDELIVAVDRIQKSFANFVRSSTKLVTSG